MSEDDPYKNETLRIDLEEWRRDEVTQPRPVSAYLLSLTEPRGRKYPLGANVVLGRHPSADIVVDRDDISRRHARLTKETPSSFVVEDLDSRNGTFINGERVSSPRRLVFGDRLTLGANAELLVAFEDHLQEQIVASQKLESLGRLARGIAHDFNNLLACILANAELLRESADPNGESAELVRDILAAGRQGAEFAQGLLGFARQSGHVEPVDVSPLIEDVARLLRRTSPEARFEAHVEPDLHVLGNRSQLYQALMNLCVNARDALEDGGRVRISARGDGERICIEVADDGAGMSPDTIDRIFDPFFSTKEPGHGTGLGMSVVHGVVENHGGRIDVASRIDRGTTVRLDLPRSAAASPLQRRKDTAPIAAVGDSDKGKILVVDDDLLVSRAIHRLLGRLGYEILGARDGTSALDLYRSHREDIALVITDLVMPRMDGEALLDALRSLDPDSRIIVMTGMAHPETAERVRGKATDVLAKPCEPGQLRDRVLEVLGR